MKKFRCTHSTSSYLYFATIIADNERHAADLAAVEADRKWSGYGLGRAKWDVAVIESGYSGPARVLECDYRRR